ncbi:MAG: sugar phosphate isomerase/epimerase family protein [Armatimonadota bacterium]|nr:sugar phosphate isomerase/epimerase family protein [Armatimonadota bacterium]
MKLTLGATTRPWSKWTFEEACHAIADAGYTHVAPFAHGGRIPINSASTPEEIAQFRQLLASIPLTPSMLITRTLLDAPLEEAVADYRRTIDAAAAAGITWCMNTGCAKEELFEKYNELFRRCAPYAWEKGVKLVMKPHGGNGLTAEHMRRVVEAVAHPAFSICYDPGNIIYYTNGEVRPESDVHGVKEYVSVCIIKDCVLADGKPDVQVLPGEGLVDFRRVLAALTGAGFQGPLYVECLGGSEWNDINHRARRTHAFLTQIVAEL